MGVLIADSPNLGIPRLKLIEKIESPTTPIDEKATTVILSGCVGELDQKQLHPLCGRLSDKGVGYSTFLLFFPEFHGSNFVNGGTLMPGFRIRGQN